MHLAVCNILCALFSHQKFEVNGQGEKWGLSSARTAHLGTIEEA